MQGWPARVSYLQACQIGSRLAVNQNNSSLFHMLAFGVMHRLMITHCDTKSGQDSGEMLAYV